MIVNTQGIVLSRRAIGEYDRLATVFTIDLGKLSARFVGVARSTSKLKALCEPGIWGEYRLHLSPRTDTAKCVGGQLITSFPGTRKDLPRITAALYCCELLDKMTPERVPSPEKFHLIATTLAALEASPSRWLTLSFGLRLMEYAGFGVREKSPQTTTKVWDDLHSIEPEDLNQIPFDRQAASEARRFLEAHFEMQTGRPLRVAEFRESLRVPIVLQGITT